MADQGSGYESGNRKRASPTVLSRCPNSCASHFGKTNPTWQRRRYLGLSDPTHRSIALIDENGVGPGDAVAKRPQKR